LRTVTDRFGKGPPAEIADIVHKNVQPPEAISYCAQKLFRAGGRSDVRFDSDTIRASGLQLAQRTLRSGFIRAITDSHACAILRKLQRNAASDASRTAGYQRHSIAQRHSDPLAHPS
jgi:hypothetical protein